MKRCGSDCKRSRSSSLSGRESDSGKYEKESFIKSIIIASGERYIAEARFDRAGVFDMLHTTPGRIYTLGEIFVAESDSTSERNFEQLKENKDIELQLEGYKTYLSAKPDYELELTFESQMMKGMGHGMAQSEPIEWEDSMQMMNSMSTSDNVKWIIRDARTGKENMDINYKIKKDEAKKIRIFNNPKSMHPMQHPIHLHGQRFVVLSRDGVPNVNLAWKDTVLVPAGSTVDLLVNFTNPGQWMIHCHIAEHLESGMMAQFEVI